MAYAADGLQQRAGHGHAPYDPEQRPAPGAAQHAERKRRVGPGDQQVDRRVIEDLENALRPAGRQRVEQRGGEIQQHHRRREHARAHECRRVALPARAEDQKRKRDQRRQQAQAVADAVGDLLAQGLRAFKRRVRSHRPAMMRQIRTPARGGANLKHYSDEFLYCTGLHVRYCIRTNTLPRFRRSACDPGQAAG